MSDITITAIKPLMLVMYLKAFELHLTCYFKYIKHFDSHCFVTHVMLIAV